MKVLKNYHVVKDNIAPQTLYVTKNANIVAVVDDGPDFILVALCPAHEPDTDLRTFQVYSTYAIIYEDNIRYLGTVGNQHLVEIL